MLGYAHQNKGVLCGWDDGGRCLSLDDSAKAEATFSLWELRERDFLLQKEVDKLQQAYPHLRIFPCYSIESWLYHPENIASLAPKGYDAETWKAEITRKKPQAHKREVKHARSHIAELRNHPLAQDASEKDVEEIYTAYSLFE